MLPQVANALMRVPQSGGQIPGQGQFGAGYLPPGYAQPLGGPNTQFPLNPQQPQTFPPVPMPPVGQGGGPVMQPGGGNAPPPQMGGGGQAFHGYGMPDIQAMMAGLSDFRNSLNDWRDARPSWQGFDGSRDDWRTQMHDWRDQRPSFDPRSFLFGGQAPATQTAPLTQTAPASSFGGPALPAGLAALPGGASQPPGVMGLIPSANPGQLPTYRGG